MPNRITIEMFNAQASEYWSNRYFTTAEVDDAGATLDAVVNAHRNILRNNCIVTKVRIDDNTEGTDNFDTVSVNAPGLKTFGSNELLPLFVVARCDFDVSGGGRPSRKYLRGYLLESQINFTTMDSSAVDDLNAFGDAIVAIGTICDPQGSVFVDAVPWPFPAMRQLRRGSKKKTTPS